MNGTKLKIKEVIISSVSEQSYDNRQFYSYSCDDKSTFNSITRFEVGEKVLVFLIKYKGTLNLLYSHSSE